MIVIKPVSKAAFLNRVKGYLQSECSPTSH